MRKILHRFEQNSTGSTMPLTALMVGILVMVMAFTIDAGMWREQSARLQEDADLAAFAVGLAKKNGMSDSDIAKLLQVHSDRLPSTAGGTTFTMTDMGGGKFRISASRSTKKNFARILGSNAPSLTASADISFSSSAPCLLTTNQSPAGGSGIEMDNSAVINVTGCDVQSNASGGNSIKLTNSDIIATQSGGVGKICHNGGISYPSWDTTAVQGQAQACPPVTDPLSAMATPTPTGTVRANPATYGWWSGTRTLEPGIYPNGLQVQNGVVADLAPGTYFITGGDFETKNGASLLSSSGVTIIFMSTGKFSIGDGSGIRSLSAPTTGDFAGILMWRPAQSSCPNNIVMNGGATFRYDGILYFPGCRFHMSNNAKILTDTKFTYVVADTLYMTGSASISINVTNPYGYASNISGGGSGGDFSLVY